MNQDKHRSLSAFFLLLTALSVAGCVQISGPGNSDPVIVTGPVMMTVTTKVLDSPGAYSPKNVVALWVEDSAGTFVRTLGVRASERKQYLSAWIAKQGSSTVDGVTGATRPGHSTPLTVGWDLKNSSGQAVTPGIYRLHGELTDHNGSGATFSMEIDISGGAANASFGPDNGFQSVTATYTVP